MRRALFAVCVAWALCAHARPAQDSAAAQGRRPTLRPSNILDEVKRYKARRPGLRAGALARHANALLARRGFDEAGVGDDGEWIEDHPKDPKNDYLSFKRFRNDGRTHVIRFTGPCT
jgi:hypothetical protein